MQHFVRHFIIIIAVKYIVLLPCGIRVKIIQIMAKPGAIKLWLPAFCAVTKEEQRDAALLLLKKMNQK